MNSTHSPEDDESDKPLVALLAIEGLLDIVAVAVNVYFISLLRKNLFHLNLRIILGFFSATLIVTVGSRIPQLIILSNATDIWAAEASWLAMFHDGGLNIYAFMPLPLTIERLLASHFSHIYERKDCASSNITVIAVVGTLYWGFALYFSYYAALQFAGIGEDEYGRVKFPDSHFTQVMLVSWIVSMALGIISFIVFLIILRHNERLYVNHRSSHDLTCRYQLAENVRTGRQLLPVLVILFVSNTYFYFVLLNMIFGLITSGVATLLSHVFDIIVALSAITIPATAIWFHEYLRKTFLLHVAQLSAHKRSRVGDVPRTLTGTEMVLSKDKERQLYFTALRSSWDAGTTRTMFSVPLITVFFAFVLATILPYIYAAGAIRVPLTSVIVDWCVPGQQGCVVPRKSRISTSVPANGIVLKTSEVSTHSGATDLYIATLAFGTPPQMFNLTLNSDTYWTTLFDKYLHQSSSCTNKGARRLFDSSRSTTFRRGKKSLFTDVDVFAADPYCDSGPLGRGLGFDRYSAFSTIVRDDVRIRPNLGGKLNALNVPFALATNYTSVLSKFWPSDGILGLQFGNYKETEPSTIHALAAAAQGSAVTFHFDTPATVYPSMGQLTGTMMIGAQDTEKCEDEWTYFPLGMDIDFLQTNSVPVLT
ncbi:hypothetical protein AAVH_26135 [Aphelenchoides avenae]|nr:hypothetical protein AAVH_26135 [Aphelenchus avenae]